jgi:hypothetical protein
VRAKWPTNHTFPASLSDEVLGAAGWCGTDRPRAQPSTLVIRPWNCQKTEREKLQTNSRRDTSRKDSHAVGKAVARRRWPSCRLPTPRKSGFGRKPPAFLALPLRRRKSTCPNHLDSPSQPASLNSLGQRPAGATNDPPRKPEPARQCRDRC